MKQRRSIINLVLLLCLLPALLRAENSLIVSGIDARSSFPDVLVTVQMRDGFDLPLGGISSDQVTVIEDGNRINTIEILPAENQSTVAMLIAIDSSRSIKPQELARAKASAREFVSLLPPGIKLSLVSFDDRTVVLSGEFASNQRLTDCIQSIDLHGRRTLLFNSLYDAIDMLDKIDCGKKIIVVYTDGHDEGSRVTEQEISSFLADTRVSLYVVCSDRKEGFCERNLKNPVELSDGTMVSLADKKALTELYEAIFNKYHYTRTLRFRSNQKADGESHRIEVRFRNGDLRIRTTQHVKYKKASFFMHLPEILPTMVKPVLMVLFCLIFLAVLLFFLRKYFIRAAEIKSEQNLKENYTPSFIQEDDKEEDTAEDSIPGAVASSESVETSYAAAWLMEKHGNEVSGKISLTCEETTLGTDPGNTIPVDAKGISPFHAKIRQMNETYHLFDLVSETGTFLNGKKLLRPKVLHDWDEIRLGRMTYIFRGKGVSY